MEKWRKTSARYYWKYVLNLEKTENNLKDQLKKLIKVFK